MHLGALHLINSAVLKVIFAGMTVCVELTAARASDLRLSFHHCLPHDLSHTESTSTNIQQTNKCCRSGVGWPTTYKALANYNPLIFIFHVCFAINKGTPAKLMPVMIFPLA